MSTISSPQIWSSHQFSPFPKLKAQPLKGLALLQAALGIWSWVNSMGWHSLWEVCRWAACEAQFVLGTRHWGAFHIQPLCLSFMNLLTTLTWTTLGVLWRSKFTSEDSQINFGLWEAWSALETNLTLKIGMHFLPWKLLTFCWYGHWDFLSSF